MASVRSPSPHLNATGAVTLGDGRTLTYLAAGPPSGFPVLYFHGAIGSPLRRSAGLEAAIARHRLRYLMVNRPGFGGSDPCPGRDVATFAADVRTLVDALGHERFSVVGVSAGAPYALACAAALPERLHRVAAVSTTADRLPPHAAEGIARRYRLGLAALARRPAIAERIGDGAVRLIRHDPERAGRLLAHGGDRGDLCDEKTRDTAVRSLLAATERGVGPMIGDYLVSCRPWGFGLRQIASPVDLWHGGRDRIAPLAAALELARRIPGCQPRVHAGEGHFFYGRRIESILGPLDGSARSVGPTPQRPATAA